MCNPIIFLLFQMLLQNTAVSLSGRLILCGSDDNNIHCWDALKMQHNGKKRLFQYESSFSQVCLIMRSRKILKLCFLGSLGGHENRVTSISMSPNGMCLASCSWDNNVRVWG